MLHEYPSLLTTDEAAKQLRLRPQTLRRWRSDSKGPVYVRLGAGPRAPIRYARIDLEAWCEASLRHGTRDAKVPG